MKTVKDVLKEYLIVNGFDGVFHDGDCACKADDLFPCDCSGADCEPGYLRRPNPGEDAEFIIQREKPCPKCNDSGEALTISPEWCGSDPAYCPPEAIIHSRCDCKAGQKHVPAQPGEEE